MTSFEKKYFLSKNANFFSSTIVSPLPNFRVRGLKFNMEVPKKFGLPDSKIGGSIEVEKKFSPPLP